MRMAVFRLWGLLPRWGLPALLRPLSLPASEGTQGLSPQGPLGLAVWATRSRGSWAPHSPSRAVGTQAQTAASRRWRPCLSALPSPLCCPQAGGFTPQLCVSGEPVFRRGSFRNQVWGVEVDGSKSP